ncbi:MAG TPA: AmmeMemoRadiSam system protein B, partial [Longimicrobiales bacterium]|nr:AmmeMemoRadiSam system protein B [Longimicrobiales bacterium]
MLPNVRPPAVAGRFYPSDPGTLEAQVRRFIRAAPKPVGPPPVALVAPHAGYDYSGAVAASAYALVTSPERSVRRVVLLGPSHFVPFPGVALPECGYFESPLGLHAVDGDAVRKLEGTPGVRTWQRPHRDEHCLEVQLPFLHVALGPVPVVPMVTGAAEPREIAEVLERVWTPETLVVVSSDLSHFLPYDRARQTDARTAEDVEHLRVDALEPGRACGAVALRGLLEAARRRGLEARCVDLRNSGDTSGSR